jgi:hypothetical protein
MAYQTNWETLDLTNWQTAIVMKTNWLARRLTNVFLVDAFRTNLVTAYQTNWKTLDLTNWQAAIVMKTNWMTQRVTNVVQLGFQSPPVAPPSAAPTEAAQQKETRTETSSFASAAPTSGAVILEVVRSTRSPNKDLVEVRLKVRGNGVPTPLLQQWRVEREDRAILCFGQDQEFKREMPPGRYKVEVKLRGDDEGSPLTVRGVLLVNSQEVLIQQNLAANK